MGRRRVAGVGGYVPRLYLPAAATEAAWNRGGPAGIERTAVPDADEDSLTLAAEAGARALDAAAVAPDEVSHLALATTTPPDDEGELTPRLASLLDVDASTRQYGGGTGAGVAALVDATRAEDEDGADSTGAALVVAADCPRGAPESDEEAAAGAGAGAVVLARDGAMDVGGVGEFSDPYPGTRFRSRGSEHVDSIGITAYEREAYRRIVAGAIEAVADEGADDGTDPTDVDAAALTAPNGRLPYRITRETGLSADQISAGTVVSETGETGAAGPFLGLASALESGAESVLLVGYGGGAGAVGVRLDGTDSGESGVPVETALDGDVELTYPEFLRRRGTITGTEPEGGGAYVSVPSWRRTIPQRHRLVAGRCRDCSALAFPPEGACPGCGSLAGYDEVRLPGTGTVEAATVIGQGGAPPEFVEQQQRAGAFAVVVVAFDGPEDEETVSAPAQVVDSPASTSTPEVGDRVVAVPRLVYEQEGVGRYGFKVVPATERR